MFREVSRSYDFTLWRLTKTQHLEAVLCCYEVVDEEGCRAAIKVKKTLEEKSSGNYVSASKSPLPGVTQEALNYPSNKLWQHMWKAANQGSSEAQHPAFLMFVSCAWRHSLHLAPTKIPDFQRKNGGGQCPTCCWPGFQGTINHQSYQFNGQLSQNLILKASQNDRARPFFRMAIWACYVNSFYIQLHKKRQKSLSMLKAQWTINFHLVVLGWTSGFITGFDLFHRPSTFRELWLL